MTDSQEVRAEARIVYRTGGLVLAKDNLTSRAAIILRELLIVPSRKRAAD